MGWYGFYFEVSAMRFERNLKWLNHLNALLPQTYYLSFDVEINVL